MTHKTTWLLDHINTEISFTVSHLKIDTVRGSFKTFDALIHTIDNDLTTLEIDMCIEAASIATGDLQRDEYLKSIDFLDTKKHKQIIFNSREIKKTDQENAYELRGDLTIKEIAEPIKLDLQFTEITTDITGKERVDLKATGRINRMNWDLNWNPVMASGGLMIDEEITIHCEITLIKGMRSDPDVELVPSNEIKMPTTAGLYGQ
jgi:polyisoprenoid-binding protein YceI